MRIAFCVTLPCRQFGGLGLGERLLLEGGRDIVLDIVHHQQQYQWFGVRRWKMKSVLQGSHATTTTKTKTTRKMRREFLI